MKIQNLQFKHLLIKKIDIIIYPKQIAIKTAKQLHQFHLIKDSEITLKVIHRAIAVDKRHPIIFKKLNTALNSYMKTQHYTDTYIAWYGSEAKFFTKTDLTVINILVLIFTVVIFTFFWRKKQFSIFNQQNQSNPTTWVVSLIAILVTVSSVVALITLWIIYETSFNEQQLRLIDNVKSRARLIEAVARHDQKEAIKNNVSISEAHNKTLNQVINAHSNFSGLGETGEFTLARKSKNEIEFIYRQRHSNLDTPEPISFQSELAIPMRLALFGHSGTIIGPDYRGENVLAAYEPVSILNLGIVAKIDLSEIREPFIRSALYILSLVILVSFLGSLLFFYIIVPVIQKMRETDQRFQKLFQENYSPILLIDPKSAQILDANKAAVKFYGYNLQELLSYNLDVLSPNPELRVIKQLHLSQKNNYESLITEHRLQNGEIRNTEILISPITINKKIVIQYIITDITDKLAKDKENKELQKELEQARKMEALGQLTGGIAHDFNNMLGIIIGYTDLTLEKLSNDPDNKIPGYLNNVAVASNRAKELIASMMLFSRTDEGEYQTLNISPLVKEDIKMLRSIIPTSIEIHSNINENLPDILIEPVKLQQLIMNLCVNARDAMDSEGSIVINLDWRKNVNNTCLISYEHITGDWIELSVTDTGSGMSKEVLQRLFEPFFTTKGKGKGTGMGMAVVHGIIKDIHAHILIDTEIGKGTRINVLFKPEENKDNNIEKTKKTIISKESHHERVLIVDDEESLSNLLGDTLESYNYRCTCFSSSRKALAAFKKSPDDFDLIISDQTMPALTGLELIKCMREIRPNIPAIIATGYSESINDSVAEKK